MAAANAGGRPGEGDQRPEHSIKANILNRQFEAAEPNQRWVTDFTYD